MPETTEPRLEYLFNCYFDGTSSQEEKEELLEFIRLARYDTQVKYLMDQVWERLSPAYRLGRKQSDHILTGIVAGQKKKRPAIVHIIGKWSLVAASLLVLLAVAWLWSDNYSNPETARLAVHTRPTGTDVAPGGNKAILILGNGSSVTLDSAHNGIVAQQGGIPILKLNGQLSYERNGKQETATIVYNTIVTPRGGQFQVILPDGSKAWLNAASSLRFPTRFTGVERNIYLTGEAYFEVAKNKSLPFEVNAGGIKVKVLGTRFNIMAYSDEPAIRTTLLDGSVVVTGDDKAVVLRPGQQASMNHLGTPGIQVSAVNTREIMAWKDGLFFFQNTDVRAVLRQIDRWYNTQVTYKGDVNASLTGMISRNTDLSGVLSMLEVTSKLSFKTEGRKIIVTNRSK